MKRELTDEELAEIKAHLERQKQWLIEHGYGRECPECGDLLVSDGEKRRCQCGRITSPIVVTERDLRRYGL